MTAANLPDLDQIQARADVVRRCYRAAPNDCYDMSDIDKAVEAQLADVPALLAYARDLEARIGRARAIEPIRHGVENDARFANGYNAAIADLRAALTATEGQA